MEKVLKLYTYKGESVASTPFLNEEEQVVITDFQYDANRMGGSPSISAKIMHRLCLDDLWTDNVYAEFNGEKYFVMNTPSSNKDNDDTRYEHEIELLSEREVLNHIYFIDAVQGDSTVDVYKSNSTKVIFMGDINEFASRLNSSLSYSNVGYNVVVDEGIVTEAKLVSFEDKYIMSALQEIFNIYEVPYYFVGKTIHIGYTDNAIPNVFKYGFEDALLSISKNNANYEVVRRCTGIGSSDNIPYYYPNESDDRAAIEASGKKWITPTQKLMPPIYRETEGAERFYNAINNTYPSPEGGYYTFENLYSTRTPNEKIVSFEDIKPSIVGMTNASGQRIDQFIDIAFDKNDNDEIDEEGNYIHSYFFVKLPKYNGEFGFNLFDHASEQGAMTILMTNGVCGACNFEIGVGEETQKNIVQVDEFGNLKRDQEGNVLWENQVPQDRQNDTQNYEVWIALKKEESTYGQIMPNASQNLKPSVGDTFVILNINLPQSYILAAEEKLKDSIIKYMFLNNNERFTFSVNFSRIYFAENPDVLAMMNENARILIEYNGKQHTLYISSFSYKVNSDSPLPEISVELTDELSVGQNSLQNALDSLKNDILSSIGGGDFLKQGLKYFLRKDIDDIAKGKISFRKGLDVGNFSSLISGGTFRLDADGKSYLEVDKLLVRMKAIFEELQIKQASYIGGEQYVTPAAMEVKRVIDGDTYYRCYATEDDNTPYDITFAIGDQALSKMTDLTSGEEVSNRYYWRLVVNVGENYIDLSKTDADSGSDVPQIGDTIISLGNRNNKDRQNAIIISSVSLDSPSIKMLQGIDSYTLTDKDIISQGFETTTKRAFLRIVGDFFAGSSDNSTYAKYDAGKKEFEIKGKFITRGGKDIDTALSELQNQIDGNIETWFYEPEPTLDNEPAVNWELNSEKDSHLGDLYYSGEGKAYRFQKDGDIYIWKLIQDTDITKALEEAKNAKDAAADAKTTADNAQTAVGDLNNYIDGSFKDGIITNAEAVAIEKYLNTVDESKKSIEGSYLILYANKYLEGTPKSNLKNAYDAVIASINTLVSKINTAISDNATTVQEKNEVDIAFASFNTKQQDYEKAVENANNAIQDKLKSFTDKVANDVAGYEYLKTAFANDTTIEGGIVSTSIVYTGYKNSQGKFVPMSGINGVYLEDETKGHGISYWAGGNVIDRETYINPEDIPADAAKAVIRMDGSGYFANGNLTWTKEGILHADPLSFFVGEEMVGDILKLFAPIYDESDRETIVGISARYPLAVQGGVTAYAGTPISLPNIFQGLILDPNTLKWNEKGQLTVIGGVGGASNWDELEGKPSWIGDTKPSYVWSEIGEKPSWIGANKPSYNWSEIGSKPTTLGGYGITDAYTKTESDNRFVNVLGDTMTGNLKVLDIFIGNNNEINSSNALYLGCRDTPQGVNVCQNNKPFTYGSSGYTVWHAGNDGVGSGLDADLLDGLHQSSFFVTNRSSLAQSTIDNFTNRESGTYIVSGAGSSGLLTVFKSGDSTSALELYTWYNWSIAKIRMTIDSNRYSEWKDLAFLDSNVASATKLQTTRYIFGQSFNGEQDVNGTVKCSSVMSTNIRIECDNNGVLGSRTSEINNYNNHLYLQHNSTTNLVCCIGGGSVGIGATSPSYKLDVDGDIHANYGWLRTSGRYGWYSQSYGGGWYMTDSTYIRTYGSKKVYSNNGYLAPYSGGMWISMATRENIIDGDQNQSTDSAHALYRVKSSSGHAVCFGGLGDTVGFYGFYKSRIDANLNGTDWETTWNTANGTLTHKGNFLATGGITCYSSDQRAKTVIEQISLSLKQIANAPTIRFKWNDWKIKDDGKTHIGGIAQYMQKLLPETVLEADDMLNMDYATTGYIFAVQTARHLQMYETRTDKELKRLKKRVSYLEKQLKQLGYEEANIMDDKDV